MELNRESFQGPEKQLVNQLDIALRRWGSDLTVHQVIGILETMKFDLLSHTAQNVNDAEEKHDGA